MTTRRTVLRVGIGLPTLMMLHHAQAAPDPSRLALVIGNSAYAQAPLSNPNNDARAMAALFEDAGFTVYAQQNASLADMRATIERFGAATRDDKVKQVVFYYAGHGVQLDWRNYLLPVDAQVTSAEQVRERCVDLNQLLEQFKAVRDKTFLIILDACRNNPFGHDFQPPQKGLSQFDAPAGSLIAYATAPGSVAADGEGKNGLYTEHLVRELSRRDTRVEDALKRVRLNVRLASKGSQVPWETTSLESDVFLFAAEQKKPSGAELAQAIQADIAAWEKVKGSTQADDWVAYLREHPNGHFAEIAQARLASLLAPAAAATAPAASVEPAASTAAPAIIIKRGAGMPALLAASANPYSAGRFPLGRAYTVGDEGVFEDFDLLTQAKLRDRTEHTTKVDAAAGRVEINDGEVILDFMGNPYKVGDTLYAVPMQLFPAEIYVGNKWAASWIRKGKEGDESKIALDFHIVRREKITVAAGEFDTFVVQGKGWNMTYSSQMENNFWVVPGLNAMPRREATVRNSGGRIIYAERRDLVSVRQQTSALRT